MNRVFDDPNLNVMNEQVKHMNKDFAPRHGGFTLVELLVVMAIIMVLMALTVGIAGVARRNAAEARARAEIENLSLEIERHQAEEGSFPSDLPDLVQWYLQRYDGTRYDVTDLTGNRPVDPWGNPYVYDPVPENPHIYTLRSFGADGVRGTPSDITNRD